MDDESNCVSKWEKEVYGINFELGTHVDGTAGEESWHRVRHAHFQTMRYIYHSKVEFFQKRLKQT